MSDLHLEAEVFQDGKGGWTVVCACGFETHAHEAWKAREDLQGHFALAEMRQTIDKAKGE